MNTPGTRISAQQTYDTKATASGMHWCVIDEDERHGIKPERAIRTV